MNTTTESAKHQTHTWKQTFSTNVFWMNFMVSADLPTPPDPITLILYSAMFSCCCCCYCRLRFVGVRWVLVCVCVIFLIVSRWNGSSPAQRITIKRLAEKNTNNIRKQKHRPCWWTTCENAMTFWFRGGTRYPIICWIHQFNGRSWWLAVKSRRKMISSDRSIQLTLSLHPPLETYRPRVRGEHHIVWVCGLRGMKRMWRSVHAIAFCYVNMRVYDNDQDEQYDCIQQQERHPPYHFGLLSYVFFHGWLWFRALFDWFRRVSSDSDADIRKEIMI